jgi:hypothetical protein
MESRELKAYQEQIRLVREASDIICNVLEHIAAGRMNRDLIVSNLVIAANKLPVYNKRLIKFY